MEVKNIILLLFLITFSSCYEKTIFFDINADIIVESVNRGNEQKELCYYGVAKYNLAFYDSCGKYNINDTLKLKK